MSVSRVKWEAFCDTLKQAGELLTADGVPQDEQTQAEGLRYLSRIARAALEWYVEFNDPEFPELYKPSHETIKIGADNPDNIYEKAVIDGRYDYLLTGHRGTVDYISMATSKGSYAENFKQIETGFLDSNALITADDGSFQIVLSQHEHEGNWLPIDEDSESRLILIRPSRFIRTRWGCLLAGASRSLRTPIPYPSGISRSVNRSVETPIFSTTMDTSDLRRTKPSAFD